MLLLLLLLSFGRDVAGLAAEAKGESFPIEDEGGASLHPNAMAQ
jgi:hypothetical protein